MPIQHKFVLTAFAFVLILLSSDLLRTSAVQKKSTNSETATNGNYHVHVKGIT